MGASSRDGDRLAEWAAAFLPIDLRLLLSSARASPDIVELHELLPRMTWPSAIELSIREGAQPVFSRKLRAVGSDVLPAAVAEELRQLERAAVLRQTRLQQRLEELLEALSAAGVPVVLLKGAAVAVTTPGGFAERPMSDLDLLVEARHARDAFAIASRCGWRRAYDREFDWIYRTMHHLPPLRDERSGAMAIGLELHTDILPPAGNPFAFSARELWGEAIHAPGLPDGIRVPSVRHRLLHCCIHFAWSHRLCSGAWKAYRDVTAIASDGSFDWNGFAGLAESSRATACVFWTLRQARALVGARIPSDVLERTKPTLPDSLIQLLERHLSANIVETARMCPSERVRAWLWRIAIRPDRDMYGAEPRRVEDGLPWHLLIGDDGGSARRGVRRTSLSPRAWRRYLATLYGSSSLR